MSTKLLAKKLSIQTFSLTNTDQIYFDKLQCYIFLCLCYIPDKDALTSHYNYHIYNRVAYIILSFTILSATELFNWYTSFL